MLPGAVVVVTGSELVRGGRRVEHGPYLARELSSRGLEPRRILVVGDRPAELEAALREGLDADLCVISGGLGPTHDDRTVETLARVAGRKLRLDPELEREIERVSRRVAEHLGRPYADFRAGVTKQASLPEKALSLGLAGTAPGVVLETESTVAVALPGPPPELRRLWQAALATDPVARVLARAASRSTRMLRFYGLSESAVARALEEAGGEGEGVEVTICAHDFEVEVELVADTGSAGRAEALERALTRALRESLFASDGRRLEEIVLDEARSQGLRLAVAESCTGGMVAERLTAVPGASDVFAGAIVAYANEVKREHLGVSEDILGRNGAVSEEAAAAMAAGARERLGADAAVAVTGIAGPAGATPEKPTGLIYLHASGPVGELAVSYTLPGDRESVRRRATTASLHLLRRVLTQSRHL